MAETPLRIAVLPIENLAGRGAPVRRLRQTITAKLDSYGVNVIAEDRLRSFMAANRVRHVGGIDSKTARAFRDEAEIDAVLITAVEFYGDGAPPKIALTSRLVSTGDEPSIRWMDNVGLTGNDEPGLLGIGLIVDPVTLEEKAVDLLLQSLARHLAGEDRRGASQVPPARFHPRIAYRTPAFDSTRQYRVAVVPFVNESKRKHADRIVLLHFVGQMTALGAFSVIEPGMVRQALLEQRVVMPDGISLENAEAIATSLEFDLIVSGRVMEYTDSAFSSSPPRVDFSALAINKKEGGQRQAWDIAWASTSHNRGDEGVYFFDIGTVRTAGAMTAQMVGAIARMMVED